MKHLPRSSPHLVHDETKRFGSIPSPHTTAHDETVLDQPLSHPLDATAKDLKYQSVPNQQFWS